MMVSCIITTYRRPVDIVERAIESVLKQTYKDIELIVVNDFPENIELASDIAKMISKIDMQTDICIRYIEHIKNMGACAARNTGINAAIGDYIALLDDDDEWAPQKIETMMKILKKYPHAGIIYSKAIIMKGNRRDIYSPPVYDNNWYVHLLGKNYIGSCSFPIIKKSVIEEAGLFDVEMKSMQDWDAWLRITQISDVVYCDQALTIYNAGQEGISVNISNKKEGYNRILEKYKTDYLKYKKQYSICLDSAGYDLFKYGSKMDGFRYIMMAIRVYPFMREHLGALKRILVRLMQNQ